MTDPEDLVIDSEGEAARGLAEIADSYARLARERREVRDARLVELLESLLAAGSRTPFLAAVSHAIGFSSLGEEAAADAILARAISEVFTTVLDEAPHLEHLVEVSRIEPVRSDGRLELVLVLPEEMEGGPKLAELLLAVRKHWGGPLTVFAGGAVLVVHESDTDEEILAQWQRQVLEGETRS